MPSPTADLGCGSVTIKYLMFHFNLLFFICGLVLIIIGGVAQGFFKEYIQFFDNEFKTPAMGLIILGSVILVISFFGCCGAKTEKALLLHIFTVLLGILLACEIAAAISIAVLKSDIEDVVVDNMNKTMQEYRNGSFAKDTWDDLQTNFHCCGTQNYTDWADTEWSDGNDVPDTCCIAITAGCGEDAFNKQSVVDGINQNGCATSLKSSALHNLGIIIGAAVAVSIIQVIGIWMSCCLVRALKDQYEVL